MGDEKTVDIDDAEAEKELTTLQKLQAISDNMIWYGGEEADHAHGDRALVLALRVMSEDELVRPSTRALLRRIANKWEDKSSDWWWA